jgi:O-antigen biosynthesis protein WbqV
MSPTRIFRVASDAIVASLAFSASYLAISTASRDLAVPLHGWGVLLEGCLLYGLSGLTAGLLLRSDRTAWRMMSTRQLPVILALSLLTAGLFLAVQFILHRAGDLPRSVLLLAWSLNLIACVVARQARRLAYERRTAVLAFPEAGMRPLLLVGPPARAEAFMQELRWMPNRPYRPVGIIADDANWAGVVLHGVRILGRIEALEDIARDLAGGHPARPAILFLGDEYRVLDGGRLRGIEALGFDLFRRPGPGELTEVTDNGMRPLSFEDLLFRPPVRLPIEQVARSVAGKRVFVTGAGGSIGSELCRQLAALDCAHLTLFDFGEFNLFQIETEIRSNFPSLSCAAVLCDIRDRPMLNSWIQTERPDILFHAAALKHVPLVEHHPREGVLTNIVGTANVAQAAARFGVEQMVMISTDKAVSPANVMGATKRLAEDFIRELAGRDPAGPRFDIVRFGNVLGSAGSVVPLFRSQIERGGPVTVTHPEVERFFMTIPEAVQLVLHASSHPRNAQDDGARLFVLEMGRPVRIVDLARQVIEMHGLRPDIDIKIQFTGLRPGEKLSELLTDEDEVTSPCGVEGILQVAKTRSSGLRPSDVGELEISARSRDESFLRAQLNAFLLTGALDSAPCKLAAQQ